MNLENQFGGVIYSRRKGQVMILTVLALGGTILGATTIAGLLMLYQVRQTSDMANSARAIFAADAGIEHAFYDLFCANDINKSPCPLPTLSCSNGPGAVCFTNGAAVSITCLDAAGTAVDCNSQDVRKIRSVGRAANSSRAFEASF